MTQGGAKTPKLRALCARAPLTQITCMPLPLMHEKIEEKSGGSLLMHFIFSLPKRGVCALTKTFRGDSAPPGILGGGGGKNNSGGFREVSFIIAIP